MSHIQTKTDSVFSHHEACEDCGSRKAKAVYSDHTWCFKCETYKNLSQDSEQPRKVLEIPRLVPVATKPVEARLEALLGIPDRNITADTCKFYGIKGDDSRHYYPYGTGFKVRTVRDKQFAWQGKPDHTLFGQDKFSPGSAKAVTIVEGELDALAGFQMLGSKYPVVSVPNGASAALKACQQAYEYLDSFEKIVICFDADEPGQKAAMQVAELFSGKSAVFKASSGFKDACDYLKANDSKSFVEDWWKSEKFVPDGIVEGVSLHDLVMQPLEKSIAAYPWDALNKVSGGIRRQELVVVTAGSGLGKSQFLREIVYKLLKTSGDHNIGLMFLEESVRKTGLSLMSLSVNKPLHLAEVEATDEEKEKAFADTLGSGRLYLYDSFGSNSIDNICNRVRYMAKGLGCIYVFLDHISIIISAQSNGDERKALDEIMTRLRMIVQETGICLFAVSHLKRPEGKGHEEGAATSLAQLRGSGSIGQLADMVIGLERHAQAEDPIERNTTRIRTIKNRYSGETGPSGAVYYDKFTGRMTEIVEAL